MIIYVGADYICHKMITHFVQNFLGKLESFLILYSVIIGRGKYLQKAYLEGMMGKYLVNFHLNKTYALI